MCGQYSIAARAANRQEASNIVTEYRKPNDWQGWRNPKTNIDKPEKQYEHQKRRQSEMCSINQSMTLMVNSKPTHTHQHSVQRHLQKNLYKLLENFSFSFGALARDGYVCCCLVIKEIEKPFPKTHKRVTLLFVFLFVYIFLSHFQLTKQFLFYLRMSSI